MRGTGPRRNRGRGLARRLGTRGNARRGHNGGGRDIVSCRCRPSGRRFGSRLRLDHARACGIGVVTRIPGHRRQGQSSRPALLVGVVAQRADHHECCDRSNEPRVTGADAGNLGLDWCRNRRTRLFRLALRQRGAALVAARCAHVVHRAAGRARHEVKRAAASATELGVRRTRLVAERAKSGRHGALACRLHSTSPAARICLDPRRRTTVRSSRPWPAAEMRRHRSKFDSSTSLDPALHLGQAVP